MPLASLVSPETGLCGMSGKASLSGVAVGDSAS